jgi:hypothetical protein
MPIDCACAAIAAHSSTSAAPQRCIARKDEALSADDDP